jgi:hypothetical protein
MGLNRSRGLGEIKCSLLDAGLQTGAKFSIYNSGDEHGFSYTLELAEPVISAERNGRTQETEGYIFGTAIHGAFAARYIEKRGLSRQNAHKDPDFRRIFLENGVKFTAALPYADGQIYYPAPAVLRTDKLKNRLFDESLEFYDDSKDSNPDYPICMRLGGFITISLNGEVRTASPQRTAFIHHSRPANRAIAPATGSGGDLYTYEALSARQIFAGSVIGNAEDVQALADLFSDNGILRIGRSRTAQYGKARIAGSESVFVRNSLILKTGELYRLVAITPLILEDENGVNKVDVNIVRNCLGSDFEIIRSVCSETIVSGYYSKWLLPRRQERAIAEGSTIVFRYSGRGTTLNIDFMGKRTGEGFGQFRLEAVPDATAFSLASESGAPPTKDADILPNIEKLRAKKEAVSKGIEYAETRFVVTPERDNAPKGANLANVLAALMEASNFKELAEMLLAIKQPEQKNNALAFATGKGKQYFQTDANHLDSLHIKKLLEQTGYGEYEAYQKYLNAAAQRIKEKRRVIERKKGGEGQ